MLVEIPVPLLSTCYHVVLKYTAYIVAQHHNSYNFASLIKQTTTVRHNSKHVILFQFSIFLTGWSEFKCVGLVLKKHFECLCEIGETMYL